ncbi:MAG: hypothetical protein R2822_16950 [Spirosomataceae bacterium]
MCTPPPTFGLNDFPTAKASGDARYRQCATKTAKVPIVDRQGHFVKEIESELVDDLSKKNITQTKNVMHPISSSNVLIAIKLKGRK